MSHDDATIDRDLYRMGFLVIRMNSDPIGAADQTNNQTERNW